MSKVTKFTIDRRKWARGNHPKIQLLGGDGKMCCLGFYALACGLSAEFIKGVGEYRDIDDEALATGRLPEELVRSEVEGDEDSEEGVETYWTQTKTHDALMETNDSDSMDEGERESKIADLFASIGVTVEFVDSQDGGQ